jgi:Domain of unknown function (DUF4136)
MRRILLPLLAAAALLAGCATTPPMMRTDVTAFHNWPQTLADKTFSFARTPEQSQSLEAKAYEQLIADQLARYGINRRDSGGALSVSYTAAIAEREVRVREPVDPFPYYGPYWRGRYWDPFWGPGWGWPYPERTYSIPVYTRTLRLNINDQKGNRLFEATAVSEGRTRELATVMPGLVASVFEGFPGESGKVRTVQMPLQPAAAAPATAPAAPK